MDRTRFWELIEGTDATSEDGCHWLVEQLSALDAAEIEDFARILHGLCAAAYRWDLWGAAYVVNGGCSDDGFEYFRAWLVAQGRATYEAALADPDSLAARALPEICECEPLRYVAYEAHEARTGRPLPVPGRRSPSEPSGQLWNFDDSAEMRRRYPRLSRR